MGLDDIIKKIEVDAHDQMEKLKQEALEERKKIIKEARREADKIKDESIRSFRREAEAEKRGMVIRARMEEKKGFLNLKRELMNEAFKQAEKELNNLDRDQYLNWLKELLLSAVNSEDEEVLISPRDEAWMNGKFMDQLRRNLKDKTGKDLSFSPELDEKERGFILKKKGTQLNYTFSALFASLREKLEIDVARILFTP